MRACAERQFIKEPSGFAGERLWLAPKRCLFFYKTGIFNFQQKLKRYIAGKTQYVVFKFTFHIINCIQLGNEEQCIPFVGEATRRIEEKMKL